MWKTGVLLINEFHEEDTESNGKRLDYLSTMMLQLPEEVCTFNYLHEALRYISFQRQAIFQELVLRYILSEEYAKALDELEL